MPVPPHSALGPWCLTSLLHHLSTRFCSFSSLSRLFLAAALTGLLETRLKHALLTPDRAQWTSYDPLLGRRQHCHCCQPEGGCRALVMRGSTFNIPFWVFQWLESHIAVVWRFVKYSSNSAKCNKSMLSFGLVYMPAVHLGKAKLQEARGKE